MNQWLQPHGSTTPQQESVPQLVDQPAVEWALAPQPGGVPGPNGGLPVGLSVPAPAEWWWLGCHGGAGVTTLQTALGAGTDAHRYWPGPTSPGRNRVVLAARTHASGIHCAQTAVRQWAAGLVPGVDLLGLVFIADAPGRLPKPLRDYVRLAAAGAPRAWHIPWVEEWRQGEPVASHLPRQLARMGRQLTHPSTKTRPHV